MADETGIPLNELVDLWTEDTAERFNAAAEALTAGDVSDAAREAHTAAGASGLCGAAALSDALREVEAMALAGHRREALQALSDARITFERVRGALKAHAP